MYALKTGCQWAALPSEYPDYRRVHYYFMLWQKHKIFDKILKQLVIEKRKQNGKNLQTSFGIIDAQSVKNTDTAKEKGYDAGKKISGIKRHIVVDTNGLPHGIYVTTANITDREGAIELVKKNKKFYLKWNVFSVMEATQDPILLTKLKKLLEQI